MIGQVIRPVDPRERGIVAVVVVLIFMVLAVLLVGGAAVGQAASARAELQRATDAAVMAAGLVIRTQGLSADYQTPAETIASEGTSLDLEFDWGSPIPSNDDTYIDIRLDVTATVAAPAFIWSDGTLEVKATSKVHVPHRAETEVSRTRAQLVLALDYSGSMRKVLATGEPAYVALESAVNGVLDTIEGLPIDVGAVFYANESEARLRSDEHRVVEIEEDAGSIDAIRDSMECIDANRTVSLHEGDGPCTHTGAGTYTHTALKVAAELLEETGSRHRAGGGYVLLVSDGQPSDASAARKSARRLRQTEGTNATVFSLLIDWTGRGACHGEDECEDGGSPPAGAVERFMADVSGPPGQDYEIRADFDSDDSSDLEHFFRFDTDSLSGSDGLADTLEDIVGAIACTISVPSLTSGPVYVFLREDEDEIVVPVVWDPKRVSGLGYKLEGSKLRLTKTTCDRVFDGADIVIRQDAPTVME